MSNYFAYMRISTAVERQKQKFTRQEVALKKFAEQNEIEFIYTAREDASGKNFADRKEWNKISCRVGTNCGSKRTNCTCIQSESDSVSSLRAS